MTEQLILTRKDIVTTKMLLVTLVFIVSSAGALLHSFPNTDLWQSDIANRAKLLHLEERINSNDLIDEEDFNESYTSFPFTSYGAFKTALSTFLLSRESKESFVDYSLTDDDMSGRLQINIGGGIDYHTSLDSSYIHPYRRYRVRGNINNRLVFWGDWWAGRFQGDLDYAERTSPLLQGWYKSHNNDGQTYTNLNRVAGQIALLFDFGNIAIGRGKHRVGDTISGSTILNDAAKEYGYFSTEIRFGKLTMSFLHASLIPNQSDPVYSGRYDGVKFFVDKYLVQHHIDYRIVDNFNLYFGEQIIYANRGIDINYLLPQTFYRITEHNQHDRDNVRIYAGGRWDVNSPVSLYGSLLLDELRKSEVLGNWWGNKYALQGGISTHYLAGLTDSRNDPEETTLEITAVRPWTYTHRSYMTNVSHDSVPLGFPEGSNLVQGALQIGLPLKPYLNYVHYLSYTSQGSLGNCWCINYNDREKDTADWLEGEVTDTIRSSAALTFSLLSHHSLKIGLELTGTNGEDWEKELVMSYRFMY